MKRTGIVIGSAVLIVFLGWAGWFYFKNLRGIGPAIRAPKEDIVELINNQSAVSPKVSEGGNTTGMPLKLPSGFSIEIFAKNLPGARVVAADSHGSLYVTRTKENLVTYLQVEKGKVTKQFDVFGQLRRPHGLAFDPKNRLVLYIAQEDKIVRVLTESGAAIEKIVDLPSGGNHFTRTIGFGTDGRLYVSIGSSCNVCNEKDSRRAAIYVVDIENKKLVPYASGLRNSVFFTWNPSDGKMWATEMGRDLLGDDLPPDEINIVEQGKDYGWPICYGKNVWDLNFKPKGEYGIYCAEDTVGAHVEIPAHSAPLGLAFIPKDAGWPKEYEGDLLVAYHGSWNRSEPTGYKIVRMKIDESGTPQGVEDFISGWLRPDGTALGRPVDILVQPGGVMYISDDKAGVIYKVSRNVVE